MKLLSMAVTGNASSRSPTYRMDVLLDHIVVVLAAGTLACHLALLLDLHRAVLAVLWCALFVLGAVLLHRLPSRGPHLDEGAPAMWATVSASALAAAAATVVYVAPGSGRWWWLFWALAVASLVVGMQGVCGWRTTLDPPAGSSAPSGWVLVLLLAAAMSIAALVTTRPDLDDVYVVNRSVHVETHGGALPTEDIVFSDQGFPGERAPLRSPAFEVLIGITAAALPVSAASVLYLGVAPSAAALSVLALWRLLRTLRCRKPIVAVTAATFFLFLDGSKHGSFGNFSFARMWQGKVVFVALVVPLLWVYAVRWGRDGSVRHLLLLATANIAAAGMSSTGLFVAPLATFIVTIGLWSTIRHAGRVVAAGVASTYPAVLALLNRLTDDTLQEGTASEAVQGLSPWGRWNFVFGRPTLALSATALTFGWLAARDRTIRRLLAVAPLLALVLMYGPRWLDPLRTITPGTASILWRSVWVLPVPAFVGLAATIPWTVAGRSRAAAALATGVLAVAGGIFVTTTTPVMSGRNHASLGWPEWKTGGDARVAERLIRTVREGSVVAAPFEVERVVPLLSSDVRAVDPRPGWYTTGVDPRPRQLVQRTVTTGLGEGEAVMFAQALDALHVEAVALPSNLRHNPVHSLLLNRGFVLRGLEGHYLILQRSE
ncbi:MAG: DUF6077 domain-containing protein [Actinomycetota bacterium]|nr:DUF6077 domain-containing protein [Actinomycetota bacterium]